MFPCHMLDNIVVCLGRLAVIREIAVLENLGYGKFSQLLQCPEKMQIDK